MINKELEAKLLEDLTATELRLAQAIKEHDAALNATAQATAALLDYQNANSWVRN